MDGHGTKWHRNIAENFSRLSRVHERYRQTTDDRQTDGRATTYSERERKSIFIVLFPGKVSIGSEFYFCWTKMSSNCDAFRQNFTPIAKRPQLGNLGPGRSPRRESILVYFECSSLFKREQPVYGNPS